MTSSADLNKWSFSSPVGSYQYYIHGSGTVDKYVNLDPSFKNPADAASKQGVKITLDQTAKWNGQTMLRTELIPQTTAVINKGKLYYHFSVKTSAENVPLATNEHQIAFFESHFTELKYGGQGASTNLQWHVGGVSKWDVKLVADEWHNVAYEIDFDAGSVAFWHSTGSAELTKTAGPFTIATSSNGADWHLGVLRLPGSNDGTAAEDWFFSGVYIESGDLTTSVGSAGGAGGAVKPAASSTVVAASSAVVAASSAAVVASSTAVAASSTVAATSSKIIAPSPTAIAAASSAAASKPAPTTFSTAIMKASSIIPSAPSSTASKAVPTPTVPAGTGSDAVLPKEFTITQFVAWLKAKQGIN
jgi:hypothetical protein